jgi:uncharacterized protein (TIGR03086 family)
METIEFFSRVLDQMTERIHAIGDDQWGAPTPCTDWDVRALVNHVAGEILWMPPLLEGKRVPDVASQFEGDLLGSDPKATWDTAVKDVLERLRAAGPDRTVHLSYADVTAGFYASEVGSDLTVHTWDVARAIGAQERLDPELVAHASADLGPKIDTWRAAGEFGPAVDVPADADPQTKLLANTGRRA